MSELEAMLRFLVSVLAVFLLGLGSSAETLPLCRQRTARLAMLRRQHNLSSALLLR